MHLFPGECKLTSIRPELLSPVLSCKKGATVFAEGATQATVDEGSEFGCCWRVHTKVSQVRSDLDR